MKFQKYFIRFFQFFILFNVLTLKSFSLEPQKFVQNVVDQASNVLTKSYTKEQKIEKLKALAKKTVDIKGIGYYSLGAHRKSLSDSKKKKDYDLYGYDFVTNNISQTTINPMDIFNSLFGNINNNSPLDSMFSMMNPFKQSTKDKIHNVYNMQYV